MGAFTTGQNQIFIGIAFKRDQLLAKMTIRETVNGRIQKFGVVKYSHNRQKKLLIVYDTARVLHFRKKD
jgi:hypothetical protein